MQNQISQPYQPSLCPKCTLPTNALSPFCTRCGFDLRYGVLNRHKKAKCIYCINTDLTEEHIFPDWLSEVFTPPPFKKVVHNLRRPVTHAFFEQTEMYRNPKPDIHNRNPYELTVRNVCSTCNNGWMSVLTNEARPLVESLAKGNYRVLTTNERTVLARWAIMVSINLECFARMLKTKEHQRQELKDGLIPSGWHVYLGILDGNNYAGLSYNGSALCPFELGNNEYLSVQNSFLCIEQVVFQTISCVHDYLLSYAKYGVTRLQQPSPLSFIWPLTEQMEPYFVNRVKLEGIRDLISYTSNEQII